ncbi:MAG: DUF1178 family protein [Rhodospirillales bacterium]|nr:DUF1178 family protein [Rhodospirillales bacterium]
MILYQLRCDKNHEFEAWFKGSAGFEAQNRRGEVECPFCGSAKVAKAPMAPNVVGGRSEVGGEGEAEPQRSQDPRELANQVVDTFRKLRRHVEENCDYVGSAFPEEARRIHYGEKESRGIYGEATTDEAQRLDEEGIEVFRLPRTPRRNS